MVTLKIAKTNFIGKIMSGSNKAVLSYMDSTVTF